MNISNCIRTVVSKGCKADRQMQTGRKVLQWSGPLTGGWTIFPSHECLDISRKMSKFHDMPFIEPSNFLWWEMTDDCGDCFRSQFASIPGVAVRAVLPGALAALTSEVGTDFGGQVLGEDVYGWGKPPRKVWYKCTFGTPDQDHTLDVWGGHPDDVNHMVKIHRFITSSGRFSVSIFHLLVRNWIMKNIAG